MLKTKLKNGLDVVCVPISGTRAATFLVLLPIGSRYEKLKLSGASHFVEHLLFKGTGKRPTTLDISRELDAVGAQYNAFTDKDRTGYWVKIDAEHQEKALDILSDMIFNSKFDKEEIEREKGVIVEEIRMYNDNPHSAADLLFDKAMFGDHPLGRDIAGTEKSVKKLSREDLFGYYQAAYVPTNMVLVAAGKVNKKTLSLIKKYFNNTKANRAKLSAKKFEKFFEKKSLPLSKRVLVDERSADQANIFFGYLALKNTDPRRYALAILANILGGNMSSRLFVEVREKRGLVYRVSANVVALRETGVLVIDAGINPKRLKEALLVIKAECLRLAEEPVSAKELKEAKNNLAGQLVLAMENSNNQANWYAAKLLFENNLSTPEEEIKKLKKVTAEQVRKLAKEIFDNKKMRLAVVGKFKQKEIFKMINNK